MKVKIAIGKCLVNIRKYEISFLIHFFTNKSVLVSI